jgi:hypothetical protein
MPLPTLHFLRLPKIPTLDRLWSILAETRRIRRRVTLFKQAECEAYAAFYGVKPADLSRFVLSLRLRERLVEARLERMR